MSQQTGDQITVGKVVNFIYLNAVFHKKLYVSFYCKGNKHFEADVQKAFTVFLYLFQHMNQNLLHNSTNRLYDTQNKSQDWNFLTL